MSLRGSGNIIPLRMEKKASTSYENPIILDSDDEELNTQEDVILKYPKGSKYAVTLVKNDLDRLSIKGFLNDSLVDFYLKYLMKELLPPSISDKAFIFSSFFYSKFIENKGQGMEKWSRGMDIFTKDYLIIPINQQLHWSLIIVIRPGGEIKPACTAGTKRKADGTEPPRKRIMFKKKHGPTPSKPASQTTRASSCPSKILHFDSLRRTHASKPLYKNVRKYLNDEWNRVRVKKKGEAPREFRVNWIPGILVGVPQQKNSYDCGMFLLHFAESFLKEPYGDLGTSEGRDHLFSQDDITEKRKEILNAINKIRREYEGGTKVKEEPVVKREPVKSPSKS